MKPAGGTESRISLTFWGVRGSIPTPGSQYLRYGGETTCFEIHVGPHLIVIDCGSGARDFGVELAERDVKQVDLLFTHTHLDHVCGLPFFCPAYDPDVAVNLWAGHIPPGGSLEEIIARLMSPPIFPVPTAALRKTTFSRFRGGEEIEIKPGLKVQTIALNHPGGATGYRFDWQGSSLAIITDHEHGNPAKDDAVRAFVENADVMVYDAMYTEAEYPSHVGWGHSTPERAIALAEAAAVQVPVLFHHDPYRSDDALDALTRAAKQRFPALETARYMMTIEIDRGRVSVDAVGGHRTAVVA